ncbi:hypothetical protein Kpol_1027p3 [Vanderwaltozyma polyspora DSM 70294]|uniref:GIT Spa2 homology (SHD) domain-containing protein n=1 Tax=Vanderwaltozyma polyspora (strain ATCC 22028 / DSM 70294 / BCRC 21397 / CBS 2163 / NBRC 10782 / NRRL Y-8283 / UCD 57-17) TaxID=436907 RepID=A7TQK8_VANPO|nr:uncharacterized protein Kpol_1027p3 [Vanderwaltozyma polyspora DSM 70294]EDO15429.1 hypothetical protein Kpol_1027p3 [Vanderwaltozyma polyspora DSM 70294]
MKSLNGSQHESMKKYHDELETFFKVTGIAQERSASSRAQKARGKLLKLSDSQFYELSTDVYDELQRRISENDNQTDHLLPKDAFHIKRNQAREKLSTLTMTRFGDLVDDILYEIKRRGYGEALNDKSGSSDDFSKNQDDSKYNNDTTDFTENTQPSILISRDESINSPKPEPSGLQSSNIIPKKASMVWSSDEEEDEPSTKDINTETISGETNTSNDEIETKEEEANSILKTPVNKKVSNKFVPDEDIMFSKPPMEHMQMSPSNNSPAHSIFSPIEKYYAFDAPKSPIEEQTTDVVEKEKTVDEQSKYSKEQYEKVEEPSKDIEKEVRKSLENDENFIREDEAALPKLSKDLEEGLDFVDNEDLSILESSSPVKSSPAVNPIDTTKSVNNDQSKWIQNEPMKAELCDFSEKVSALSIENEKLRQRITELEIKDKDKQLQRAKKSANATLPKYSLNEESITKFISEAGQIPFYFVSEINLSIQSFFSVLESDQSDIGNELFEILFQLTNQIDKVVELFKISQFRDQLTLLRASLSHLISSVRYYAVYGEILPKITVQAAAAELIFALCKLISVGKITPNDNFDLTLNATLNNTEDESIPNSPVRSIASSSRPNISISIENSSFLEDDGQEEISPVKPLKITQKANRILEKSTFRKPSGTSMFSSILETRPTSKSNEEISSKKIDRQDNNSKSVKSSIRAIQSPTITQEGYNNDPEKNKGIGLGIVSSESPAFKADTSSENHSSNSPTIKDESTSMEPKVNTVDFATVRKIESPHLNTNMKSIDRDDSVKVNGPDISVTSPDTEHNSRELKNDKNMDEHGDSTLRNETHMHKDLDTDNDNTEFEFVTVDEPGTTESSEPSSKSTDINDIEDDNSETEVSDEFDIENFEVNNPENTLSELLSYVEHQTVEVISTIQTLLTSIKDTSSTKGGLKREAFDINNVISQMVSATSISMEQTRNYHLKEHGSWVVQSLEDCSRRIITLCEFNEDGLIQENASDNEYADKQFKQRLAGIAFDIAKCTKELVKSVEEASLKEESSN